MPNVIVQTRISAELKEDVEAVFAAVGLTTSQAIRIFMQQCVNCGELPFKPTAKTPNRQTRQAMKELEDGGGRLFQITDQLFADW